MSVKAIWNGTVLAESDHTVVVEGNHYFPPGSVVDELLVPSPTTSTCPWKGQASYYSVTVDGQTNPDAAWTYQDPSPAARDIKGHVAFWRGVQVVADEGPAVEGSAVEGSAVEQGDR